MEGSSVLAQLGTWQQARPSYNAAAAQARNGRKRKREVSVLPAIFVHVLIVYFGPSLGFVPDGQRCGQASFRQCRQFNMKEL